VPRIKKISEFKPLITNLAQTSHYQVMFGGLNSKLSGYLNERGVNTRFIAEESGLLCSSASIPGSSLATADINGNFMGMQEKMAHTRIFTEMQIKFLEHWMEYIVSGGQSPSTGPGYYYRMQFPEQYKCDQTKIIKFDRNGDKELEYKFFKLFPKNLTSIPVSYGTSDILKVSASFEYERYIAGKTTSKSVKSGTSNNRGSTFNPNTPKITGNNPLATNPNLLNNSSTNSDTSFRTDIGRITTQDLDLV
jgi:hypothetical protein